MNTEIPIKEIMTTDLITISKKDNGKVIKEKFDTYPFHHLLVLNKNNHLVGLISKSDFYRFAYSLSKETTGKTWSKKKMASLTAKELMTKNPYTLAPEDTIGTAAELLLSNKFHAIPIVEADQLVGILTTFDLLAYGYNKTSEQIAGVME